MRDERGIGLVEVMVTVLIVTVGVLTTLASIVRFGETSYEAQRRAALTSVAQREIERLRALPYDRLGLTGPVRGDGPPPAVQGEPLVSGGVVDPGAELVVLRGLRARVFRYVTWRPQACPLLRARIASQLGGAWGVAEAEVQTALADLCPGSRHTKRITVAVAAEAQGVGPGAPVVLSSVVADPSSTVLAEDDSAGLRVQPGTAVEPVTGQPGPGAGETVTPQRWYLHDTPCTAGGRVPTTADHPAHDTSSASASCAGGPAHDLMSPDPATGSTADQLYDLSTDVHRPLRGALALRQDSEAGECGAVTGHADGDDRRRGAIHTWATPPATATARTPAANARAVLTFFTQTAAGVPRPARLCIALRRSDTGAVLGSALHALPSWPAQATQLAVAFDIASAELPPGARLLLTLRNPSDGESDVLVLYDHPAYPTDLSVTMATGAELR